MAHVFDASLYNTGSANPQAFNFTCGDGATLLVLGITVAATARTIAAPTYGGAPFTAINRNTYDPGEVIVELWALTNPSTGNAYSISIPNAGTARTLYNRAVSFKAQAGYTSVFDSSACAGNTSANPYVSYNAIANGVSVQIMGDGYASLPTQYYSQPTILPVDHGAYTSWMMYYLPTTTEGWNNQVLLASGAWTGVNGSWKEQALSTPRVYGGILKFWNGGSWVECPSTQLKFYNGSDWTVCPSNNFKVYVDNAWYPVRREG